ncbi:MAG: hypothetical protein JWR52_2728 [Marmoricola sp.]|nr:hypothetical protein [Marmoricola sp.]
MSSQSFAGTAILVRQVWRRDRVLASVWTFLLVAVSYASASATASLYSTEAARVTAARAINASPAIVALYGPILDVHSLGEFAMTKMTVLYAVFVAVMFIVLVRRHTRVEEESGQTELVGGTAVGRDAPLAAAVLATSVIAVGLGILTAVANVAGGLPLTGSLAFGGSWTGLGLVAIGVAAVACQFSASARTCASLAAGAIGVLYVMRAVGDTSQEWVSWLTPLGWGTRLRAYSGTRWWVLGLYVVLALVLFGVAQLLRAHRDLGAGLVAARPGRTHAESWFGNAQALAWKVHASTLLIWSVASAVLGAVFGAIAPNLGDLLKSSQALAMMQRLGGTGVISKTLIAAELSIIAVVVTCFALSVVAHAGADEAAGRTGHVLCSGSSRWQTFAALVTVAFVGSVWLMTVIGIFVSLGYGIAGGGLGSAFADVVPAAVDQVPAIFVVAAIGVLFFAIRGHWTVGGWAALVAFLTLGQLGELLQLPTWVIDLSPFAHVPAMPVSDFAPLSTAVLLVVATGILALAWASYRSRDVV